MVSVYIRYTAKDAVSERRISRIPQSRTFVVSRSPTPQLSSVVDQNKKEDDDAKQLATPGESKSNNNTENVSRLKPGLH